jgi:hypothetical protein
MITIALAVLKMDATFARVMPFALIPTSICSMYFPTVRSPTITPAISVSNQALKICSGMYPHNIVLTTSNIVYDLTPYLQFTLSVIHYIREMNGYI